MSLIHASVFTGIGGFDLAAEWAGWENEFQVEKDPFCQRILSYYFPEAKKYHDIKQFNGTEYRGAIDVLSGGFPCQPYSTAGKRLGKEDERHLWPEMRRVIREVAPSWVVGENVRGLVSWSRGLVFEEVCADLEAEGYEVQPFLLPAAGVNAPHLRERIIFAAYSAGFRRQRDIFKREGVYRTKQACGETRAGSHEEGAFTHSGGDGYKRGRSAEDRRPSSAGSGQENQREWVRPNVGGASAEGFASNAASIRKREQASEINSIPNEWRARIELSSTGWRRAFAHSSGGGREQNNGTGKSGQFDETISGAWGNFPTQSPLCGGDDGLPRQLDGITFSKWRTESLKGYGNAVVPQMALQVFKAIQEYENMTHGTQQNIQHGLHGGDEKIP